LNISVRVNKKDVLLAGLLAPLQAAPFFIYACLFGGGISRRLASADFFFACFTVSIACGQSCWASRVNGTVKAVVAYGFSA
jgi:hypothetical protein